MKHFHNIKFKKHRLHPDDGVHGILDINDNISVSICSGGGAHGKLAKIDYWILIGNKHEGWVNNIKSTFEVAVIDTKKDDIVFHEYGDIIGKLNIQEVDEFIEDMYQRYQNL